MVKKTHLTLALVRYADKDLLHACRPGGILHVDDDSVRNIFIDSQQHLRLFFRFHVPAQLRHQIVRIDRLIFHLNHGLTSLHAHDDMDHVLLHRLLVL